MTFLLADDAPAWSQVALAAVNVLQTVLLAYLSAETGAARRRDARVRRDLLHQRHERPDP